MGKFKDALKDFQQVGFVSMIKNAQYFDGNIKLCGGSLLSPLGSLMQLLE